MMSLKFQRSSFLHINISIIISAFIGLDMFHVWSGILSHLTSWIPAPDSEREIDSAFNSQSDHKAQVSASSIARAFHLVWFVGCTDEGDHAISFQLANVFITNLLNDITNILIIFLLPHIGLWDRRSLVGNRKREKERERVDSVMMSLM